MKDALIFLITLKVKHKSIDVPIPEDRLKGLDPEIIEAYFKKIRKQ